MKVEDSWEGLNILRRRRSENKRNDKGNKSISNPNQMRSINWRTCALILTRSNTSKELSQEGGNGNYVQERIDLKDDYKSIGTKCGVVCIGNNKSCMVQVMCSFLHAYVPKIKRVFISTNIFLWIRTLQWNWTWHDENYPNALIITKGIKIYSLLILDGLTIIVHTSLACQNFHDKPKIWNLGLEHHYKKTLF